jgi:carboxylesterase type B
MMHCLFFVVFALVVSSAEEILANEFHDPPLVKIDVGEVMGTMKEASTGKTVYQYLGIPYAEPPIGSLRFEPPVPVARFQSTIEAIALKPSCIQVFAGIDVVKDYYNTVSIRLCF